MLPFVTTPPNKISMESDTPVESRMKTAFTFTFSPKTNHGYGWSGTLHSRNSELRIMPKFQFHNHSNSLVSLKCLNEAARAYFSFK